MNENKLIMESLSKGTYKVPEHDEKKTDYSTDIVSVNQSADFVNPPVYTITVKDPTKRPKSTSYTDWRGQISRPTTGHKHKQG